MMLYEHTGLCSEAGEDKRVSIEDGQMALSISRESLIASFQDTLACANGFVLSQRTRQSMMLTSVYDEGMHSGMRVSATARTIRICPESLI